MALRPDAVGKTTAPLVHEYTWENAVLYALGVGCKTRELDFLYEGRGPKVLPTYAVVPTFPACGALFDVLGGDLLGVVHGGQAIRVHKPFAPSGRLTTVGTVAGVYDLKRLATAVITTETKDAAGELVCETTWNIIYRFDGDFGGAAPPKRERVMPPDRAPDFVVEDTSSPEQALLYRLGGRDFNPLHADPAIGEKAGFGRPILHGLGTYGYVGRAVLDRACGGDPERLRSFKGDFTKPVWPGDTIITEGWMDGGRVIVRASVKERPGEVVFGNATGEVEAS